MVRENLAVDPSLRSKTTDAYTPIGGATISYSTEYTFYGVGSLKVRRPLNAGPGIRIADPVPVMANKPYAFSMYARIPVVIPHAERAMLILEVSWMNSLGAVIKQNSTTVLEMDDDSTWYRIGGVWTAPAGATFVSVAILQSIAPTTDSVIYLDALLIEQSKVIGGYFDELTVAEKIALVNKRLAPVPQVINGVRLGADVILNDHVFNTVDEFGTVWVITDIEGWWGQTAPDLPDIPRGTEEGSYDVQGRATARSISISGFFIPSDSEAGLSRALDQLVMSADLVRKGGWFHANEGPTKAAWVRLSADPKISTVNARGKTEFSIPLRAGDPIKYHWNDNDPDGYTRFSTTSSDIPTKTVYNYALSPSFEFPGSNVALWKNIVKYPDGSTGATTGWGSFSNTTLTISTSQFRSGLHSYSAVGTASGSGVTQVSSGVESSSIGTHYYSMWVKSAAGTPLRHFMQEVLTDNSSVVSTGTMTEFTATGGWQEITGFFSKTQGATTYVRVACQTTASEGATIYADDAMIVYSALPVANFTGESAAPDPDLNSVWDGVAGASTSTVYGNLPPQTSKPSTGYAYRSREWASTGEYSLKVGPTYQNNNQASYLTLNSSWLGDITAGTKVTVRAVARISNALGEPTSNHLRRLVVVAPGASFATDSVPNATGVYPVAVTFTMPAGATSIQLHNGHQSGDIWWDDILVTTDASQGFFYGDTPNTPENTYSWSGEPGNSKSVYGYRALDRLVNIGTARVTGVFTFTGPAGVGTAVYNATTDERMVLDKPLRGYGLAGAITQVEATKNIATAYTSQAHGLRVGDEISLSGMVLPFSGIAGTRKVLAVSDIFPYSFSFKFNTDNINKIDTGGQVTLVKNDVLVVDTYNRTVHYNGERIGHRNWLTTLTDWIHFEGGENVIQFYDDATRNVLMGKRLVGGTATLTTTGPHYLRVGEKVKVDLPESRDLQRKSLTGNKVTITTVGNHGYAIGDEITVNSTESAVIVSKSRSAGTVTLATESSHGVSVGDQIVVDMPKTFGIRSKARTASVVTIESLSAHGYSSGDVVTVALPTSATLVAKEASGSEASLTTSGPHGFVVGDSISVNLPTKASIVNKTRSGSSAILETSSPHGFSRGDVVTVALPESVSVSGSRVFTDDDNMLQLTIPSTAGWAVGDLLTLNLNGGSSQGVSNRSSTATTCTVTLPSGHGFAVGDYITVTGIGSSYNGTYPIQSVTATTVTYTKSGPTESSTASGGTAVNATIGYYNGGQVLEQIVSSTSIKVRVWSQDLATSGTASGTIINETNKMYNGSKEIASLPSPTKISYLL